MLATREIRLGVMCIYDRHLDDRVDYTLDMRKKGGPLHHLVRRRRERPQS